MSVTAKEIAKMLNLSETAVSLALRGKPGVSTKTRQLVTKTAADHGYDFSRLSGHGQLNGTIYMVLYRTSDAILSYSPIFNEMVDSIRSVTHGRHLSLKIVQFYEQMDDLSALLDEIRMSDCIGIILIGTEATTAAIERFDDLKLPLITLDSYFHDLNCDSVSINNESGAYRATTYLMKKIHGTPGYLSSSIRINNFEERKAGFQLAVHERGLSYHNCPVHLLSPSFDGAMTDMLEVIDRGDTLAGGYFADNDIIAIGAIKALKLRGYRVPEDVAIIGFDNISEGRVIDPSLTTMDVPRGILAEQAVRQLLFRIGASPTYPQTRVQIMPKLVKRFSL